MNKRWFIVTLACLLVVLGMGTALAAMPDQPMAHQPKQGMMAGDQHQPMMGQPNPCMPDGQMPMTDMMKMMQERHLCPMLVAKMDDILKAAPEKAYYRVGLEDLKSIYDSQTPGLLILDVRPQGMYEAGHIPGSLSIPLPTLVEKMSLIHPDTVVYVVCAVDSNATFAAYTLRMVGYDAYMVPGGVPAWKDKGYPLTTEIGPVQMPQMTQMQHPQHQH
ncbi:MAG: Rhodanese-like domain protein [Firmicutes bacterium]|nr:Rhodanese-like domain protein [Bacillota bacterium]